MRSRRQQAARVKVQGPTRRVIRVESEETQDHVRESLAISQEEADEIGFLCQVLQVNLEESIIGATTDAVPAQ